MNSDEAKILLSALSGRDSEDSEDPQIADALALLETDSDLRAWYEDNCRSDEVIRSKFADIAPPADLRTGILTGLKISRQPRWWQHPPAIALAAAATITLIAVIGLMIRGGAGNSTDAGGAGSLAGTGAGTGTGAVATAEGVDAFTAFQRAMVRQIENVEKFDFVSHDSSQIAHWVRNHNAPAPGNENMPGKIAGVPPAGCKLLEWNGHKASLVCFIGRDDNGNEAAYHMVIADQAMLASLLEGEEKTARENGWSTAAWRDGSQITLLATRSETDPSRLRKMVQPQAETPPTSI